MDELKPCPFCGNDATTAEKRKIAPILAGGGWVGCQLCHIFIEYINGESGKRIAIDKWNTREGKSNG